MVYGLVCTYPVLEAAPLRREDGRHVRPRRPTMQEQRLAGALRDAQLRLEPLSLLRRGTELNEIRSGERRRPVGEEMYEMDGCKDSFVGSLGGSECVRPLPRT